MEEIKINRKMNREMMPIGDGSEGIVYKYNDKAIKLFMSKYIPDNKLKKIKLLNEMDLNDFQLPQKLVIDKIMNPIGYTMDFVKARTNVQLLLWDRRFSVRKKIVYLQQTEELIKKAHELGIVIGDVNLFNFLINEDEEVKAIDTDNYQVKDLKNDIEPDHFFPLYKENVSNDITPDTDKFSFILHIIKNLLLMEDIDQIRMIHDINYVESLLDSLEIPNELKDFIFSQLSNNNEKKYCSEYLDLLSNYDEPYLKLRH